MPTTLKKRSHLNLISIFELFIKNLVSIFFKSFFLISFFFYFNFSLFSKLKRIIFNSFSHFLIPKVVCD